MQLLTYYRKAKAQKRRDRIIDIMLPSISYEFRKVHDKTADIDNVELIDYNEYPTMIRLLKELRIKYNTPVDVWIGEADLQCEVNGLVFRKKIIIKVSFIHRYDGMLYISCVDEMGRPAWPESDNLLLMGEAYESQLCGVII